MVALRGGGVSSTAALSQAMGLGRDAVEKASAWAETKGVVSFREEVSRFFKLTEEGHVSIRSARRDAMETAKKQQKEGKLSEDDAKRIEKEIQAITDRFIKDIDAHLAAKEKELTTV